MTEIQRPFVAAKDFNTKWVQFLLQYHVIISNVALMTKPIGFLFLLLDFVEKTVWFFFFFISLLFGSFLVYVCV